MSKDDKPIEIKDLNKTQLILLALLLSFVTSIATGIVTVTLMQQAPPQVTRTVNRVVQQTVEKVSPTLVETKTQTVIITEDDLIIEAVKQARGGFISLYDSEEAEEAVARLYILGKGKLVDATGKTFEGESYFVGEGKVPATVVGRSELGFTIFESKMEMAERGVGTDSLVSAGQTLVVATEESVDRTIVQKVEAKEITNEEEEVLASWNIFTLNQTLGQSRIGAPVITINGDIVGFVRTTGVLGIDAITSYTPEEA